MEEWTDAWAFFYSTKDRPLMSKNPEVKEANFVICVALESRKAEGMISIAATWIKVPAAIAAMMPRAVSPL